MPGDGRSAFDDVFCVSSQDEQDGGLAGIRSTVAGSRFTLDSRHATKYQRARARAG